MTLKSVRNVLTYKDTSLIVTEESKEMLQMVFDKLNRLGQIISFPHLLVVLVLDFCRPLCRVVISSMAQCYNNNCWSLSEMAAEGKSSHNKPWKSTN